MVAGERTVIAYKDYFLAFFRGQSPKVKAKILETLRMLEVLPFLSSKHFKHIEGTKRLYEVRVEVGSDIFRIFAFFDHGNLVILGNAFQKKTQKTPSGEIKKALLIMQQYHNDTNKDENSNNAR